MTSLSVCMVLKGILIASLGILMAAWGVQMAYWAGFWKQLVLEPHPIAVILELELEAPYHFQNPALGASGWSLGASRWPLEEFR